MNTNDKKFIDIDAVFESKNPGLYKYMPGFILAYLKRIVHQDQLNLFIKTKGHLHDFEFAAAIIEEFRVKVSVIGLERLEKSGGIIYAANHPLGGLDGIALLHVLGMVRRDVKFIVNDILMQVKNLGGIFIGVNKLAKNTKEVLDGIDSYYASDGGMLIFPAGLVSRLQDGIIADLAWNKSFIAKAKQHKRNIVPIHIAGRNTNFFYKLSYYRKKMGIKANLEMLYLVDEMYKQFDHTITITIGQTIPYQTFDSTYTDAEWAQKVKAHVYVLESNKDSIFRP